MSDWPDAPPLSWLWKTHSVPRFEGERSHVHQHRRVSELAWTGIRKARAERERLSGIQRFVQFAGFPRSGHSLLGAILAAHPAAAIAHELDAMGLVERGLPARAILGLILDNTARFAKHGHYWNGLRYRIDWPGALESEPLRVIGDKKGDWAVRRFMRNPGIIKRLARLDAMRRQWILVTRNPFDNIAVMSLRKNRRYDRLRIETLGTGTFRTRLTAAIAAGEITDHVLDEMIDDYAHLCQGIENLQRAVPAQDWLTLNYEHFCAQARAGVGELFDFVGLPVTDALRDATTALIRAPGSRPSERLHWTAAQRARVTALIAQHRFLADYGNEAGGPAVV